MSLEELDIEPIPGMPESPPEGEKILWQGKPGWWGLANRVFHVPVIAFYFGILILWQGITTVYDGAGYLAGAEAMVFTLPYAVGCLFILGIIARSYARTTIYTITSRRVLMRFGVALPITYNFPFCRLESASLRQCKDGSGDLPLTLRGPDKIAYLHLWPFARPWFFRKPQPMLRALKEPLVVANLLAEAMQTENASGKVHTAGIIETTDQSGAHVEPGLAPAE